MQQIGEYTIGRLIGEGGMGKVYEAEERLSRRKVALKVLRQDLAQSEDGRRLFLREMTILSHLDHPNVVRCLACTEADGQLVMVLEHLDGVTLRDVLRQQTRVLWQRAVKIAIQVASGLGSAHGRAAPIIHRDLKPENIMVLAGDEAKVMDFGIAKILDEMGSQTVFTVGTLQYMSPEQIEGKTPDPRSDLYCLGLVLYEMLAGQPPFASESPRELLNLHCTQAAPRFSPEISREVPPALEQLVFALLAKDPNQRPPNADAVRVQLEQIASGGQPAAQTGTSPAAQPKSMGTIMLVERAGTAQKRSSAVKVVIAIVAVVAIGLGTGGYVIATRGDDEPDPPVEPEVTAPPTKAAEVRDAPKTPTAEELEAKALEVKRQAELDRERASGGQPEPPDGDEGGEDEGKGDEGGGSLLGGISLGIGKGEDAKADAKEEKQAPAEQKADEKKAAEGDDEGGLLDIFGRDDGK